ncbi:MAG: hypothetical protein ABIA12_01690 [Candidatus Aenigmatarchaeota archaeon]
MALMSVAVLSGCIGQNEALTAEYKNDVISIEDYYVSNIKPSAGSEVTMQFLVQNNGEQPVSRVVVSFFDTGGMEIVELGCSGTERIGNACVFDSGNAAGNLEPFDVRSVELRMRTLGGNVIKKPIPFTLSYYVEYDYAGYRKADLPVVDGVTVRTASSKYSQSTASYSPVRLDFEMPARGEHKEDGKTVKDYWGVRGEPFEVIFKFTDVASSGMKDKTAGIAAGNIRLDTKGSLQAAAGLPCDFRTTDSYMYSTRDAKVPGELRCNFKSYDFTEPQVLATLWAEYSYTYRYTLAEEFEVQPAGQQS